MKFYCIEYKLVWNLSLNNVFSTTWNSSVYEIRIHLNWYIVSQKSYLNLLFFIEIHYWILLQNFRLINMFANSSDIMRWYPILDVDQIVYFSQTFQTYQKQKNSDEHSRNMESRYLRWKQRCVVIRLQWYAITYLVYIKHGTKFAKTMNYKYTDYQENM